MTEKPGEDAALLREIRSLHGQYPLSCATIRTNGLPGFDDDIMAYVVGIMRDRPVPPPPALQDRWDDVLACLRSHWINPFLYWRIMSAPRSIRPPGPVMDDLRVAYTVSVSEWLKSERQIAEMARDFGAAGIGFLVLKGAALGRTIYPGPFLRPGSDIDILVRPGDVRRARDVLSAAGYRCIYPNFEVSPGFFCAEEYAHRDSDRYLPLELHWDVPSTYSLKKFSPAEGYFSRSVPAKAGKADIRVMGPADALVSQAVHMIFKHRDSVRLSWINDIAFLCRYLEATDGWDEVRARVAESKAGPHLGPALRMARLWTGVNIPDDLANPLALPGDAAGESAAPPLAGNTMIGVLRDLWPADATLIEKGRVILYFAVPPGYLMREQYFLEKNNPLTVLHVKRWAGLIARNLRVRRQN